MVRAAFLVSLCLVACSGEEPPPELPVAPAPKVAPAPDPVLLHAPASPDAAATAALAAPPAEREPALARLRAAGSEGARSLIRQAAAGTLTMQGEAPILLEKMGAAALPALGTALREGSLPERRIAVLALLEMGTTAAPLLDELLAARNDADPSVRAGAELAWKRASGDTSDADRRRAEHAAAEARAGR